MFKRLGKFAIAAMLVLLSTAIIFSVLVTKANDTGMTAINKPEMSMSADKEVYRSAEEMEINVSVTLPEDDVVTLKLYGIPDSRGNYRVNEERNVSVGMLGTNETFVFRMPSCYGCAGVAPGDYDIVMEALEERRVNRKLLENGQTREISCFYFPFELINKPVN